jgi:hypothetical protein
MRQARLRRLHANVDALDVNRLGLDAALREGSTTTFAQGVPPMGII